jgi:hypothetical protein
MFPKYPKQPREIQDVGNLPPIRILPTLLLVAFSLSNIVGIPHLANAASEKAGETAKTSRQMEDETRKKILQANDLKLKAREPLFPEQAKSLAKDYRETAKVLVERCDDPKPVLDAAAYFEKQSEAF